MDIQLLEKMRREIQNIIVKKGSKDFMLIKREVLNLYGLKENERREYSSLLSKHFGVKGGKSSAEKKKKKKEMSEILKEARLTRMVSDAQELEQQEAIRAGDIIPDDYPEEEEEK